MEVLLVFTSSHSPGLLIRCSNVENLIRPFISRVSKLSVGMQRNKTVIYSEKNKAKKKSESNFGLWDKGSESIFISTPTMN